MTRTLTPKGEATRARIVDGAAHVLRESTVADASLDDILARTRASKSQLFHYFPEGKEQLLLAVAELEAARVLDEQQPELGALTSFAAWDTWREVVVERYRQQGQTCPLSALVSQLGRSTPGAQAVVSSMMNRWHQQIEAGITAMQDSAVIRSDLDATRTASAILAGVQGGVVMMLSTGRLDNLEAALDTAIDYLRLNAS